MVTVVDACNFPRLMVEAEDLKDKNMAVGEDDERNIANLLVDQVEFRNVIVVTKADLLNVSQTHALLATLRRLNPGAEVLVADHGKIEPAAILGTSKFDMAEAANAVGWLAELRGEHTPETEEYGIGSFVYQARRPFHPRMKQMPERAQRVAAVVSCAVGVALGRRRTRCRANARNRTRLWGAFMEDPPEGAERPSADLPCSTAGLGRRRTCAQRSAGQGQPWGAQRLYNFLVAGWRHGNLVRSKGYFWLASRFDQAGSWSQAGGIMNHGFAGLFCKPCLRISGPTTWTKERRSRASVSPLTATGVRRLSSLDKGSTKAKPGEHWMHAFSMSKSLWPVRKVGNSYQTLSHGGSAK